MRHGFKGRRFARSISHRKSMFANLAVSLIEHEQIVTTLPKAKDLRPIVEKLVTLGKRGDLHARRQVIAQIGNEDVVKRLFETVDARPAVARARAVGQDHDFKQVRDEEAKRALFPSNYPPAV